MPSKPLLEILKIANDLCKTQSGGAAQGVSATGSLTGGAALHAGTFTDVHLRSLNDQKKQEQMDAAREMVPPHLRDKFAEAEAKSDPIRSRLFMLADKVKKAK
jgi:hypothetical protein